VVLAGPPNPPLLQTAFQCPNAGGAVWTVQSLSATISAASQDFLDVVGTTLITSLTNTSQDNSVFLSIPAWPLSSPNSALPGTRHVIDMATCVMTTQHPPQGFQPVDAAADPGILNLWVQTSATNASTGDFPAPNSADPILLPQGYTVIVTLSRLAFERTALQALGAGLILNSDQINWDQWNEDAGPGSSNPQKPLRPDKQIRYYPSDKGIEFIVAFDTIKWLQERPSTPNGAWTTPPLNMIENTYEDNIPLIGPPTHNRPKVPMSSSTFLCTVSGGTVTWTNPPQRTDISTIATDTGPPFIEDALIEALYFPGLPFVHGVPQSGAAPTAQPDLRSISLALSINGVCCCYSVFPLSW
jgi:hypothetical protein